MSDLQSLLERLKGATGPDRELDRDIAKAVGVDWSGGMWWRGEPDNPNAGEWVQANFTASVDAVLALKQRLLPDEPLLMGERQMSTTLPWARVGIWREPDYTGATLALAACAALLQALIASKSPSETD